MLNKEIAIAAGTTFQFPDCQLYHTSIFEMTFPSFPKKGDRQRFIMDHF
jgi:hypothetical protein